jgi:hypothetical protein
LNFIDTLMGVIAMNSIKDGVEIRVYANQLDRENFELLHCDSGMTLNEYLIANVPSYDCKKPAQFSVLLNSELLEVAEWKTKKLIENDLVECIVEPKGLETAAIVMIVIAVASAAYAIYVSNQPLPDTYNSTTPKGSSIYDVNAQGNRPRLMGTAPILFGRHKVYPDYLVPPRIEYINNEQYYYALLSVAAGRVALGLNDIYIGDTNISNFGSDIQVELFQPGASVAGNDAHRILYSSVEVGASGSQTGLVLAGSMAESNRSAAIPTWRIANLSSPDKIALAEHTPTHPSQPQYRYFDWSSVYYNSHDESVVGKIVELTHAGANDGYYRVITVRSDDNHGSSWQKLTAAFDVDNGWSGFATRNFTAHYRVFDIGARLGWFFGPYLAVPEGATTNKIQLDFRFNRGLCILDGGGNPQTRSVDIEIQYKHLDGTYARYYRTFTAATVDQQAFTETINIPAGSVPSVRVRRITSEIDDIRYKDLLEWVGLKSELPSRSSYPEFTTMAIRIRGSDAVSSSSNNKIGCVPVGVHAAMDANGNVVSARATRDVSAAFMKIADDIGYDIDLDALGVLHKKWIARGDTFDAVFDNETTAWKAMQQILAVGFTEPTLDFGKIIPVRDEPRTVFNYQYQPDNILPNSWKMDGSFVDRSDNDGVEVEYMSEDTWKPETILCLLPGDAGNNPEKIRVFGVTGKTAAYRFGMRHRSVQKYRRIRHHFSTEMDALNSRYMSYDALGIDMPGYSQTGQVESVAWRTLQLNQDLEWGGGTYYIGIRRPDGTLSGPYTCSEGADSDKVVINVDLDFEPVFDGGHEPPYFMFGKADEWCIPVLVTDIKPSGTDKVKVTAFEYSEDVYLYDDAVPLE